MNTIQVLSDEDIDAVPLADILHAVKDHLIADAQDRATTPARHGVPFLNGSIVFTTGGSRSLAGFRAYETFDSPDRTGEDQIVALWDRNSCRLKGIALGRRLGAIRTGILGGIATDILAPRGASICGIVGSGQQAETQILAASIVRQFKEVRVFSRNQASRSAFADKIGKKALLNIIPLTTARQCVEGADVVILATDSESPVIDADWVSPLAHVTTLGPKSKFAHELPFEMARRAAIIASDSPQQIAALGEEHMLHGTIDHDRIVHLGKLATQFDPDLGRAMTLYLSAGLAGSEVAALDAVLAYHAKKR